ncbi:MAG: acyltransferase family protein [Bacteroidales bacterium]|nr:acyltransferase family protein [Bacteroidales bacterium]
MIKKLTLSERRYDIDWIRIMLIFSVFLFHIGMFFNGFGWHIKNPEKIHWLDPLMAYLHTWRMPLLFLISGVGTYYALGKRSMGQFVGERSRKLMIPLIFGMLFIVPPQVYVEKQAQYGTYWNFIPHITQGSYPEGNLSWHHLWFILYLFICAMAAIPFIVMLRSRYSKKFYRLLEYLSSFKGLLLVLLTLPLFFSQLVLLQYFPEETHALTDDWAYIAKSFLFFLYGYVLLSNKVLIENITEQRSIHAIVAIALTGLFFTDWFHSIDPYISNTFQLFLLHFAILAIGFAIIGYAARYLNKDHPWRYYLNEAIYPFYILHQTVILVIGFYLLKVSWGPGIKALVLTIGSFVCITAIYLLLIRPFKITRLLFGMQIKTRKGRQQSFPVDQLKAVSQ